MSKPNPLAAALDRAAPKGPVEEAPAPDNKSQQPETPAPVAEAPVVNQEAPVVEQPPAENTPAPAQESQEVWWDFDKPKASEEAPEDPKVIAEEFSELLEDPDVSLLLEFKKAGKGLNDLIKEYQEVDYDSMDYEKLAKEVGKLKGYNEEEIEEMVDDLKSLGRFARDKEVDAMKALLNQQKSQKRQKIVGSLQQDIQKQQYIQQKAASDLALYQREMVGKEILGVKLDAKDSEDFGNFAKTFNTQVVNEDGTVSMGTVFEFWLGKRKLRKIQSIAASNAYAKGQQEVLSEITRPVKAPVTATTPVAPNAAAEVKHDPRGLAQSLRQAPSARKGN